MILISLQSQSSSFQLLGTISKTGTIPGPNDHQEGEDIAGLVFSLQGTPFSSRRIVGGSSTYLSPFTSSRVATALDLGLPTPGVKR
jgi:hypothetical protein